MLRKDAGGRVPLVGSWKSGLAIVLGLIGIVAIGLPQDARTALAKTSRSQADNTGAAAAVPAAKQLKVMAVVNGKQITRQQLADECIRRYGATVLESTLNKHLIWQACKARGVEITDEDVNREITHLASKFGLSPGRWLALLQQERDLSPEQYRREIIWPTLALRALAAKDIVVTPEELQNALEADYGPRVKVRAITVRSAKEAEQLRAAAMAKPDEFGRLAKEHSVDQSASVHGLIPPIRKHVGDENLERIAFGLKEGEISPVIPLASQFVILKCEKHLPETYIAPRFRKDAENRVRERLQDEKLRSTAARLFKRLQDEARVTNVLNKPELRKKMPGVAALINGQKISMRQLAEECIARHGKEVLAGEVNRQILLQELKRKSVDVTEADIDQEIARAADSYGYLKADGTPNIEAWLEAVTKEDGSSVELYVRDAVWPTVALKKLVDKRVTVTDEDIRKGFDSNFGPRVEVLAIVFSNQRQAQKVWEMARSNPTDTFFGELAHQYSTDPISRENFGRVPPIRRYGGRPEMEEEAFSLKPGQFSGIIASGDNYVILRCTGYTTPVVTSMDSEVRAELVKDIHEKKLRLTMAVEFDRLCEAAQIDDFLNGTSQAGKPRSPASSRGSATASRPVSGAKRR